MHTSGED